MNDNEYKIYKYVSENPKITRKELELETKISPRTIARIIDKLKDEKYIERVGSNKVGYWKVLK